MAAGRADRIGQADARSLLQARDAFIKRIDGVLDERDVADFDRIVGKILAGLD